MGEIKPLTSDEEDSDDSVDSKPYDDIPMTDFKFTDTDSDDEESSDDNDMTEEELNKRIEVLKQARDALNPKKRTPGKKLVISTPANPSTKPSKKPDGPKGILVTPKTSQSQKAQVTKRVHFAAEREHATFIHVIDVTDLEEDDAISEKKVLLSLDGDVIMTDANRADHDNTGDRQRRLSMSQAIDVQIEGVQDQGSPMVLVHSEYRTFEQFLGFME